ncbi:MAG: hypothetical protein CMP26_08360 [Roseibacillus sp.]|nr:hypothetical protein [Roseibacillus sp.]
MAIKTLVLLFAALVVTDSSEKEQPKEQEKSGLILKEEPRPEAKAEPKPEFASESRELPPLPETVTAEFITGLWAKPHNERDLIEKLKDDSKADVWKAIHNIGPSKEDCPFSRFASTGERSPQITHPAQIQVD